MYAKLIFFLVLKEQKKCKVKRHNQEKLSFCNVPIQKLKLVNQNTGKCYLTKKVAWPVMPPALKLQGSTLNLIPDIKVAILICCPFPFPLQVGGRSR